MNSGRLRIRDHLRREWHIEGGAATAGKAVASIIAIAVFLYLLRTILLPFVLAGIGAFICHYAVDWLGRRFRLSRTVAAVMVLVGGPGASGIVAWLAVPPLLSEAGHIATNLHPLVEGMARKFIGDGTLQAFGGSANAGEVADGAVAAARRWISQERHVAAIAAYGFSASSASF